jgi:hypothetical protein
MIHGTIEEIENILELPNYYITGVFYVEILGTYECPILDFDFSINLKVHICGSLCKFEPKWWQLTRKWQEVGSLVSRENLR